MLIDCLSLLGFLVTNWFWETNCDTTTFARTTPRSHGAIYTGSSPWSQAKMVRLPWQLLYLTIKNMGAQKVELLPLSKLVAGSSLGLGPGLNLHVFPVFVWVFSRYSGFLTQTKNIDARLIFHSKFTLGMGGNVNGCLSIWPCWWMWSLSRVYPTSSTVTAEDRHQFPLIQNKWWVEEKKWMDK